MVATSLIPSQFHNGNGKGNLLGILFFSLTFVALVYQIVSDHKQIKQLEKDEKEKDKKMLELETNVKALAGTQYILL